MRWDRLAALHTVETEWKAEWVALTPGSYWLATSHPGEPHARVILAGAPQMAGSAVHIGSWQSSAGAITLELTSDEAARYTMQKLVRGSLIRIWMRWRGEATWQRVTVGQVHNLRGARGRWNLQCWDLLTATRSRVVGTSSRQLFSTAGNTAPLTSAYAPAHNTLQVFDTAPFEREDGEPGAVQVTPTTGDPFYLTYTGTSGGNTLTGVSTSDLFGTTRVAASSGDLVSNVPLLTGHPWDIVQKVWTSTGSGTNGRFDTLPSSWGLALPQDLLDLADLRAWRSALGVSSGSYSWSVLVDEAVQDGRAWLGELLAPAGVWMTARDGRLTLRAVQDLQLRTSGVHAETIDPRHVVRVDSIEPWAADVAVEYRQLHVTTGTGNTTRIATVGTLPSAERSTAALPHVWDNESAIASEAASRLAPWAQRIPEALELTTTWRYAGKVEGDTVFVPLEQLGVFGLAEVHDQERLPWMVSRVARNLRTGTCSLALVRHPSWEGALP